MKNTKPTLQANRTRKYKNKPYQDQITIKAIIRKPKTSTASIKRAAKKAKNKRNYQNRN